MWQGKIRGNRISPGEGREGRGERESDREKGWEGRIGDATKEKRKKNRKKEKKKEKEKEKD